MNNFINFLFNERYPNISPIPDDWKPDPTAFSIGNFPIQWYGIFFTLGFIFAIILASIKLEYWYKVSYTPFYFFVFIGIPVSILGARIWSFIIGDAAKLLETKNFFSAFFDFRQGGLAIQGGVVFAVIAGCIYFPLILKKPKYNIKTKLNDVVYVKQVSSWVYADAIIPCVLIGQIIGRWGNFMNQEVYGPSVSAENIESFNWLKNFMPAVWRGMFIKSENFTFHQPFFLYESMANFAVLILLYVVFEFIKFRKVGDIALSYFFFYGLIRIFMEPFRSSDFKFSASIVTSALFIVFSVLLIVLNHLIFSKNRNFKFWAFSWFIFKKSITLLKQNLINIFNKNKKASKLEFSNEIKKKFYRSDSEMYYYNGY